MSVLGVLVIFYCLFSARLNSHDSSSSSGWIDGGVYFRWWRSGGFFYRYQRLMFCWRSSLTLLANTNKRCNRSIFRTASYSGSRRSNICDSTKQQGFCHRYTVNNKLPCP